MSSLSCLARGRPYSERRPRCRRGGLEEKTAIRRGKVRPRLPINHMKPNTSILICVFAPWIAAAVEPCRIEVVEKGSGWPVPLVELRTTHHVRLVTDNAGVIAFDLPELMGRETWFDVIGHGYEVSQDGFGYRGVRLIPKPAATLRVEVTRTILAKRLGRLTGGGLFAESQKLGREREWRESGILGCDSVQNAVHRGKLFWAWGDTTMPHYPLGLFDMSSATTSVRPLTSFEPPLRLSFDYFTDPQGTPRSVAKMPGSGPTWVSAYVSLPDKTGTPRLVGTYVKIKPPMEAYECGLCVWNESTVNFERHRVVWTKSEASPKQPRVPEGHPVFWKDADGKEWVLFGNPLPTLRCPATFEAWQDSSQWEALQPPDRLLSASDGKPVKPHSGSPIVSAGLRCSWRPLASHRCLANCGTPKRTHPAARGDLPSRSSRTTITRFIIRDCILS
jgi:hypothetical protein